MTNHIWSGYYFHVVCGTVFFLLYIFFVLKYGSFYYSLQCSYKSAQKFVNQNVYPYLHTTIFLRSIHAQRWTCGYCAYIVLYSKYVTLWCGNLKVMSCALLLTMMFLLISFFHKFIKYFEYLTRVWVYLHNWNCIRICKATQ